MLGSPDNDIPTMKTREARRRRVVMPLVVVTVLGVLAVLLSGFGRAELVGSGSTLAQPLIEQSAVAYRNARTADDPLQPGRTGGDWSVDGAGIDYEPVGSLGGIMRLADADTDFAISDYPLSEPALEEKRVAQFPVAISAIAVVHDLDLPAGVTLRLDAATLAAIYQGTVTRWNAAPITALNPGVALPDSPITPVHRTDGSGSTFGFTTYLATAPAWTGESGSLVSWKGGTGVERSGGMVSAVTGTPGAIGYVEAGQATRAGLQVAQLANAGGHYAGPTAAGMAAALAGADWSGDDHYVDGLPTANRPGAYPLTVAIYAVLKRDDASSSESRRALRYLAFLIEDYDASASQLGYTPLPDQAAAAVRAYWTTAFGSSA